MDEIWERLEAFLQENAPEIYEGLAPGATGEEIAEVERLCGFRLPADVRQSYLRHDGQSLDERWEPVGGTFIPCCFGLLSMSKMPDEWQGNVDTLEDIKDDMPGGNSAGPGVKPVFLDAAWVPFAKDVGGNQLCLDFDPAPDGVVGQIIKFDHESDGQRCLAQSFRAWLDKIVGDLEVGRLVWNEELEGYDYPE